MKDLQEFFAVKVERDLTSISKSPLCKKKKKKKKVQPTYYTFDQPERKFLSWIIEFGHRSHRIVIGFFLIKA